MKRKLLYFGVFIIIGVILFRSESVIRFSKDAMDMCYEIIIPSLFPFFVCSGLLIYSGFGSIIANLAQGIMRPIFNVAPAGAAAFVMGILSGFPSGAICTADLYRCGNLSKSEAERLLAFCNNSGPLFIIGAIGTALYHKPQYGVMLYVIHIISSIIVGIIFRNYKKEAHNSPPTYVNTKELSASTAFATSLNTAAKNMITVCFSIIFFSAISRAVLEMIPSPPALDSVISGICEFSTGVIKIYGLDYNTAQKLILTSLIVGFSGISVHIQVAAVTAEAELSLKPYIIGKCLHSITAAVLTAAVLFIIPPQSVFISDIKAKLSASFAVSAILLAAAIILVIVFAVIVPFSNRKKSL